MEEKEKEENKPPFYYLDETIKNVKFNSRKWLTKVYISGHICNQICPIKVQAKSNILQAHNFGTIFYFGFDLKIES